MGNCSSSDGIVEFKKRNAQIDREIERDRRNDETVVKLLLLGAGESGKSTVLKQMKLLDRLQKERWLYRIIHDNGYAMDEAVQRKTMVYANVIHSMGAILNGMSELKISLENPKNQAYAHLIQDILAKNDELSPLTEESYRAMKSLWADHGVQQAFKRKDEYYLNDSAQYFLDSIDRINDKNYVPTVQDILHTRIPTMGVIEVTFHMKNRIWRVFDVGGQRSQRKKWIHCFDDAKAVIFVAALSEYDQVLLEDNVTNRMQESLLLFQQVCNNRFFLETNIILFLNKKDIFMEKIVKGRSLKTAFPEYNGPDTFDAYAKYIEKKFFSLNAVPNKAIYCHLTCATDTQQVQFVLDSVLDTILSSKLKGCGLY